MSLFQKLTTRNVGAFDRVLRMLPLIATTLLWQAGVLTGLPLVVAGVVSAMLFVTAITGMCSIYGLLGLSTRRKT